MLKSIKISLRLLVLFTAVLGLCYPLAMTGAAQLLFPGQANGSLLQEASGQTLGSALIGQAFSEPQYFHGRPSAAGDDGYDAANSAASNLGPTSAKLIDQVAQRAEDLRRENGKDQLAAVPGDLVTASASGLDPHISVAAAAFQSQRVAAARNVAEEKVTALIRVHTEKPLLGFLGEEQVNVVELNRALDQLPE